MNKIFENEPHIVPAKDNEACRYTGTMNCGTGMASKGIFQGIKYLKKAA